MKKFFNHLAGGLLVFAIILQISSCVNSGCTNTAATNYNCSATKDDGSCRTPGCINPTSLNYNAAATYDNESCVYPDGYVTFWYNSVDTTATVNIAGRQGAITEYYSSGTPTRGAQGYATFALQPGTYPFSASSSVSTWSGTVTVSANDCSTVLLH